jgi:hypothetical protein
MQSVQDNVQSQALVLEVLCCVILYCIVLSFQRAVTYKT